MIKRAHQQARDEREKKFIERHRLSSKARHARAGRRSSTTAACLLSRQTLPPRHATRPPPLFLVRAHTRQTKKSNCRRRRVARRAGARACAQSASARVKRESEQESEASARTASERTKSVITKLAFSARVKLNRQKNNQDDCLVVSQNIQIVLQEQNKAIIARINAHAKANL